MRFAARAIVVDLMLNRVLVQVSGNPPPKNDPGFLELVEQMKKRHAVYV